MKPLIVRKPQGVRKLGGFRVFHIQNWKELPFYFKLPNAPAIKIRSVLIFRVQK